MTIDITQDVKGELADRMADFELGHLLAAAAYQAMQHALAEIERLEGELATFARASVDLSNQLVMCKRERDALTDRMIAAGLMA